MTGGGTGQAKGTHMAVVLEWVETGRLFPLPLGRPAVIGRSRQAEVVVGDRRVDERRILGTVGLGRFRPRYRGPEPVGPMWIVHARLMDCRVPGPRACGADLSDDTAA